MMSKLSRRNFLKGAAVGAMGAGAAAALAGCSPKQAQEVQGQGSAQSGAADRTTGYCGPGDWLGEAPAVDESKIVNEYEFDVVVLGGGHSGLMAACGAVDEGATVGVVEMQPWSSYVDLDGTGTNMAGWYGEDIGHVNSDILIKRGFGPFNTGEIAAEFCKRAGGRVNTDIVRAFVQNSGAMVNRYKEIYDSYEADRKADDSNVYLKGTMVLLPDQDVPDEGTFDMSNMFDYPLCNTQAAWSGADVSYPIECGGYKTWPCNIQFYGYQGNNIEFVHKYIVRHTQENGAQWFFEHTGIVLEQNESGDVTGLIAEGPDGQVRFKARKGVILAAGDFIGDPAMCWALLNEGMEWAERAGSTKDDWTQSGFRAGTGHKMGCWAGGMIEPTPRGWMSIGGGASGPWGTAPVYMANANGKRFCNEGAIPQLGPVGLRQPAGLACWVSDANWKQTVGKAPLDHGAPNFGMDDYMDRLESEMAAVEVGSVQGTEVGLAALAERKMMKSVVFAADTLDELAGLLGYSGDAAKTFVESIEHYNDLCASADGDTDYGKDKAYMVPIDTPPFYGGKAELSHTAAPMMVTMSGLVTDETQNVLRQADWMPIKGLYAAGNCLGGRYGFGYSTPFAGNSIGMAMTHGWLAGKTVAHL